MILLNLSRSIVWHCFSLIVKIIHRGWSSNVSPQCKKQQKAWETIWNILKHHFPTTGFKDNDADSLSMISWKVLVGNPCLKCAISVWEACLANFFIRTTEGHLGPPPGNTKLKGIPKGITYLIKRHLFPSIFWPIAENSFRFLFVFTFWKVEEIPWWKQTGSLISREAAQMQMMQMREELEMLKEAPSKAQKGECRV